MSQFLNQAKLSRNRLIFVLLGVLVMAALLTLGWSHMRHHTTAPNKNPEMLDESGLQTEDELNDYKHDVEVTVTAQGFSPQTLRIPNNTRINWTNRDGKEYRIAISPGSTVPREFDINHLI